jgi:hypothetical protein
MVICKHIKWSMDIENNFFHQGHPRLVNALSKVYTNLLNLQTPIDSQKEVLVTDGAYEALFCAIMVRA